VATFSGSPTASADDGYVDDNGGTIDNSATAVQVRGSDFDVLGPLIGYVRVPGVTIPQGATINEAKLTVIASASFAPVTATNVNAFDEDSSDQIADATDYNGRSLTGADADGVFAGSYSAGDPIEIDVATIVQEVVDRAGWDSGNAMQFVFQQTGAFGIVAAEFASLDHATYAAPSLSITYTAGGGGSPAAFLPGLAGLGWC